jgi:hypothetical protein
MPLTPKPNFMTYAWPWPGFLSCLDRADADTLQDIYDHVSQKRGPDDPLAALVNEALSRRRSGQPSKP